MARLPLEHVRIVDLTQAWAGSYALQLLGDFGAEIVKVESRSRPDPWRGGYDAARGLPAYPTEGPGDRPYNRSYLANSVNRNKFGITLDLNDLEGRQLFLDLVRTADVVTENFTPRVMGNLGIGYDRLQEIRPGIILLSMPAFGTWGPYGEFPGIGGTIEPMSGNAWLLGEPGGAPQVSGVMYPDAVAGLNGASAVLTALVRRRRTGEGCHIEVSQHESMIAMLGEFFAHANLDGLSRMGNRDLEFVPNGIYRCRGEEQWVAISIRSDGEWQSFSSFSGQDALRSDCFATGAGRRVEEDRLDQLIGEWSSGWDAHQLEAELLTIGIPAARVRTVGEAIDCPQMAARNYFVLVEQPEAIGPRPMPGIIAHLSETPGAVRLPPVEHGRHSREILRAMLGLDEATLDRLELSGVIGEGPPP